MAVKSHHRQPRRYVFWIVYDLTSTAPGQLCYFMEKLEKGLISLQSYFEISDIAMIT